MSISTIQSTKLCAKANDKMKIDEETTASEQELDLILTGRTLRVYWFLLKMKKPVGRKDVQRGAKLSSASLSEYHLKKLTKLGLVEKLPHGDYVVTKIVRVGVARFYINIRNNLIPRFALYSSFYLIILFFSLFFLTNLSTDATFLIMSVVVFGLATSIFELIILLKSTSITPW